MSTPHHHISPRKRSLQQRKLTAAACLWGSVVASVVSSSSLCIAYKMRPVNAVITQHT